MRIMMLAAGAAFLTTATPALAQQANADVNSYLCTFAGKCGDTPADATPTMAAPPTKGFRLASSTPSMPAPPTKGFRLANGAQSTPTMAAPQTRSFRVVRTPAAAPVASAAPVARPVARRAAYTPARPAMAPGATRADLMLTFEYNSDRMTPAAQARARTFAQALNMDELRAKRFMIEGHTDARGSRDANIDLSRRRAQTVVDFLVSQGVDRTRVEVKGVGPDQPLPGRSAAAEANRRVEAVLLS